MTKSSAGFYDKIANFYDNMTHLNDRIVREKGVLQYWVERYQFRSALDAGCGSGVHTLALAALGIHSAGIDSSTKMIQRAKKNALELGFGNISFIKASFDSAFDQIQETFDAIFCMGNSLSHILDQKELLAAIEGFDQLLNLNGILVIQILNYDKILDEKNRIVAITREDNHEYIRFYDFMDTVLRFNILDINWLNTPPTFDLYSTELYPYREQQLAAVLDNTGFHINDIFGSMQFEKFDSKTSQNLIFVGKK
jgi:2-polyprenyl-3-methyl-5-hydroxy-6-metoxy-1,4-benzoquinol methylase